MMLQRTSNDSQKVHSLAPLNVSLDSKCSWHISSHWYHCRNLTNNSAPQQKCDWMQEPQHWGRCSNASVLVDNGLAQGDQWESKSLSYIVNHRLCSCSLCWLCTSPHFLLLTLSLALLKNRTGKLQGPAIHQAWLRKKDLHAQFNSKSMLGFIGVWEQINTAYCHTEDGTALYINKYIYALKKGMGGCS